MYAPLHRIVIMHDMEKVTMFVYAPTTADAHVKALQIVTNLHSRVIEGGLVDTKNRRSKEIISWTT